MAHVSSFDATLDTCVLLPMGLCDTLLRFAEDGFYRPHWSEETLGELLHHLVSTFNLSETAAQKRVDAMNAAFPEALVTGHQRLIASMTNHPKDRHVLAAAVRSSSQVIVTSNLKDFPAAALAEFDIEAQSPDRFLLHQADLDPRASVALIRRQAADKAKPPRTVTDIIDRIANNAPTFATAMRILLGLPHSTAIAIPPMMTRLNAEVESASGRVALQTEQGPGPEPTVARS